jgi:hypothetical protein
MEKKTKVETLSAVCTKNQNSKTVIKTIIDGGHRRLEPSFVKIE